MNVFCQNVFLFYINAFFNYVVLITRKLVYLIGFLNKIRRCEVFQLLESSELAKMNYLKCNGFP